MNSKTRNRFGIAVKFKNGTEGKFWIGTKRTSLDYLNELADGIDSEWKAFTIWLQGMGKVVFDPREVLIATLIWEPKA